MEEVEGGCGQAESDIRGREEGLAGASVSRKVSGCERERRAEAGIRGARACGAADLFISRR